MPIVYCEDNRCHYWKRGRCRAKILLIRSGIPPVDTGCPDCQWCAAFESTKQMRELLEENGKESIAIYSRKE